ncbi:replication protein [Tolumonas lignilytica]|uniref:replication protein n=1 Tax=Tolumonas lignilytica TaxID=1283284 RepID=UPI0004677168|nr:replication protein [Tolumonas lignilytica]
MSTAEVIAFPTPQIQPAEPPKEVRVADCDDGYTKTANEIQKMKCKIRLSGREHNILEAVIYSTYGWNKKQDRLTNTYLANMCDMDPSDVNKALIELGKRNVITIQKIGVMKLVGINKTVSDWVLDKQPKPKKQDSNENGEITQNLGEIAQSDRRNRLSDRAKLPNTQYSLTQDNKELKDPSSENPGGFTNVDSNEIVPIEQDLKPNPVKNRPDAAVQTPKGDKWGTAEDLQAAEYLFKKIQIIRPTAKTPNWPEWANTIRIMREADGRTHREICELFKFANQDAFWSSNILSPAKLRDKWDTLCIQRETNPAKNHKASSDEWAAAAKDTSWGKNLGGW